MQQSKLKPGNFSMNKKEIRMKKILKFFIAAVFISIYAAVDASTLVSFFCKVRVIDVGEYNEKSGTITIAFKVMKAGKAVSHHDPAAHVAELRKNNQTVELRVENAEQALKIKKGKVIEVLYEHSSGFYSPGGKRKAFSNTRWAFSRFL